MKFSDKAPNSVLIISSTEKGITFIRDLLDNYSYAPVNTATNAGQARRLLSNSSFDFVIINTPLSDEFGYELALQISENSTSGVLLIAKSEVFDEVCRRVEAFGVFTIEKPLSKTYFHQAMQLLIASKNRLKKFEKENKKLQSKIDEIRLVNRAKYVLIKYLNMSEQTAHRYIEKQAMDMRVTRKEIAERILKTYEN